MTLQVRWRYANFIAVLIALLIAAVTGPLYALPPAYTRIENRAEATYMVGTNNRIAWSNETSVSVKQVADFQILPSHSDGHPGDEGFVPAFQRSAIAGQRLLIPYRLTNTGNGTDTFDLSIVIDESHATSTGSLIDPVIYLDLFGDGLVDAVDPRITEVTLASGESAALIVSVRTGTAVIDDDQMWLALQATSRLDPQMSKSSWGLITIDYDGPVLAAIRVADIVTDEIQPLSGYGLGFGSNGIVAEYGDRIVHTIYIDNVGYARGYDIEIREPMAPSEKLILNRYGPEHPVLVSGTPVALGADSGKTVRLVNESDGTRILRIVLPEIETTQRILVQYEVEVNWEIYEHEILKETIVIYEYKPGVQRQVRSNDVLVKKGSNYAVELAPQGGSMIPGAPDLQRKYRAFAGQKVPFDVTVQNTGRMAGIIELGTVEPLPPGWSIEFFDSDGETPLEDTNQSGSVDIGPLTPGATRDVRVVVTVPKDESEFASAPYLFEMIAYYADAPGRADTTWLEIRQVHSISHMWDPLYMTVNPPGVTTPGTVLTYNLVFGNASELDAKNVVIVQNLSPYLHPPEILGGALIPLSSLEHDDALAPATSDGTMPLDVVGGAGVYDADQHVIVWTIPYVEAFHGGRLQFRAIVSDDTPEGGVIEVQGVLTSDVSTAVAVSNVVVNVVLTEDLRVNVTSEYPVVAVGDINGIAVEVKYLDPLAKLEDVHVIVDLPPGLTYRKGTAKLSGMPISDPKRDSRKLIFTLSELKHDQQVRITFDTLVNAAAEHELEIVAKAEVETGPDEWAGSRQASTRIFVVNGILGDNGVIVGRLTVSGTSELEKLGVGGVRIYLDNGLYVVSDREGRFSFASVRPGPRVLRIDPATLVDNETFVGGFSPVQATMHRVIVPSGGIAMVDFPLIPSEIIVVTSERFAEVNDR